MIDVADSEVEVVSNGGEVEVASAGVVEEPLLSAEDATKLTIAISETTETLWGLLYLAWKREAHRALGLATWGEYLDKYFSGSRSAAYSLLAQGTVINAITEVAPEGTEVFISQAKAKMLKKALDDFIPTLKKRVEGKSPEEAEQEIQEAIDEQLEQIKEDKKALQAQRAEEEQKNLEAKQNMYEEAATQLIEQYVEENGGYTVSGLEEDENTDYDDDIYYAEEPVEEEPQYEINRKAIAQRNLYETIGKASSLPEPKEALEIIPPERAVKTHTELSDMAQKIHEILQAIEERYSAALTRDNMTN